MLFRGEHVSLPTPCGPHLSYPPAFMVIGLGCRRIYSSLSVLLSIQTGYLHHRVSFKCQREDGLLVSLFHIHLCEDLMFRVKFDLLGLYCGST